MVSFFERRPGRSTFDGPWLQKAKAECEDLFDESYYRTQTKLSELDDAWRHYALVGVRNTLNPSPYIDGEKLNEEFSSRRGDIPLRNLIKAIARGRDPSCHPLFDSTYYRMNHPEIGDEAALLHFIRHGDGEGHRPSMDFDPHFYADNYLEPNTWHAFRHYITVGRVRGYIPRRHTRDCVSSQAEMRDALATNGVLIVSHEARYGGGPAAALLLGRELLKQDRQVVFVLLRGGPQLPQFQELGRTFLVPEGWDADGLWDGVPAGTQIIVNTGVSARSATALRKRGHNVLLLIHEFPSSLMELGVYDDCLAAVAADAKVGFALKSTQRAFEDQISRVPIDRSIVVGPPPLGEPATDTGRAKARDWFAQNGSASPRIAGAGFADHRKGFDIFLDTARAMHAQRPDAHFVWFGGLGDWGKALADEARREGIPLALPGQVDDFDAWIGACDALLITSRSDVGPTTMLHAAREGVPVVAFDTELGAREYVERLGLLVEPGNFAQAVAALTNFIDEPDDAARERRLAEAAAFNARTYTERVLDVLA